MHSLRTKNEPDLEDTNQPILARIGRLLPFQSRTNDTPDTSRKTADLLLCKTDPYEVPRGKDSGPLFARMQLVARELS